MFKLELSLYAEEDIVETFNWYNFQVKGLGKQFLSLLDKCLNDISEYPIHYQVVTSNIRRGFLEKFPYAVFFEITEPDQVMIYGVIHTKRSSKILLERL